MRAIPRPRPPHGHSLTFLSTGLACFLFLSPQVRGWPGDLDLSFNDSGFRRLSFPRGTDFATAAAVQSDGKVVVVGRTGSDVNTNVFVIRLTSDGTLDPSFGTGGKVVARIGSLRSGATAVKLQTDGKIVVSGYATSSFAGDNSVMAVLRYDADGKLDPTFAGDGIQLLGFPGEEASFATALTLQSDGKIVAVGKTGTDDSDDFAIIRLNTDGTADDSFAGDGTLRTSFGSGEESAEAVAIQSDGKIVVAGWTSGASYHNIAISRYSPGGVLDLAFDGDGKVVTDLGANSRAMTLTIHNRLIVQGFTIVVGGYRGNALFFGRTGVFGEGGAGSARMAVLRYQSDGELDDSFGGDGIAYSDFPSGTKSVAMSIAVQSPQLAPTYLVAGFTGNEESGPGPDMEFGLARFESDGTPDTSLAGDGTLAIDVGNTRDYGFSVALNSSKIITAGWSQATRLEPNVAVCRLHSADGSTDTSFSGDGIALVDVGPSRSIANDVKLQSDGKIVVAGMGAASMALARLQPDGGLDTSFNLDGLLFTSFPTFPYSRAEAVAIAPDGKLVAAGADFETFDSRFALARFLPSGLLDIGFNGDGKLTTQIGGNDWASDIIVLAGKLHVVGTAGQAGSSSTDDFAYARYDTNGSLEDLTVTQIEDESHAAAMAVQPSGKIVAVGTAFTHPSSGPTYSKIVVVRYSSVSGEVDSSFGEAGIVSIDLGGDNVNGADITVDGSGRVVVIGNVDGNGIVARLTVDGDPDETFGSGRDGITTPLDGVVFRSVDIQGDGKIVVAGESGNEIAVVRFQSTGALSSTYGESGVARNSLGSFTVGFPPRVHALTIDSWDRAVVAGEVDGEMVVARLLGDPSYARWALQEFPQGPPFAAAPDADPDGDGLANSLEYLLASDPWSFTPHPLIIEKQGNSIELLFTLRRDRFDVSYEVLRTNDLDSSWQAATGTTDSQRVGAFTSFQFSPVTSGPLGFFKLGATISPP